MENKKLYQVLYLTIWLLVGTPIQAIIMCFLPIFISKLFACIIAIGFGVLLLNLLDTYIEPYFYDED